MPANLSPEYRDAEAAFRKAGDSKERLECLREMLRTIPKHKGTDHLQADLKTRIKNLTEEVQGEKRGANRTGPVHVIRPEGAAQIALLGPPNTGKSSLHHALTGSHATVGPYPYTTHEPQPGMLAFEDVHFQLIDLPPVSPEHPLPWIGNALQPSDGGLVVVDLNEPDCLDQVNAVIDQLKGRRITLLEKWGSDNQDLDEDEIGDPFAIELPILLIAMKCDLVENIEEELVVFQELLGSGFPTLALSVSDPTGLQRLGHWLFDALEVVRVYTKAPGRPADTERPFTVRAGDTVLDVARLVHREMALTLRFARIWGETHFDGQQVGREQVVKDGDILELHA